MLEVEVKRAYKCEQIPRLRDKIKSLGFKLVFKGVETDIYYKHPCRDFKVTDEALRIRLIEDGGECTLTYKGPKIGEVGKVREELNVELSNFKGFMLILNRLGFKEYGRVRKFRETYVRRNVRISIDNVEGLGCFIEIEATCYSGNFEELLENIEKVFGELNVVGPSIRKSYLELLLEKKTL